MLKNSSLLINTQNTSILRKVLNWSRGSVEVKVQQLGVFWVTVVCICSNFSSQSQFSNISGEL